MPHKFSFILFLLVFLFITRNDPITPTKVTVDGHLLLEDFSGDRIGDLPKNWFNRNGDRNPINYEGQLRSEYQYSVLKDEEGTFLRFEGSEAKHLLLPLGANNEIDLAKRPVLSWKWRVHQTPSGANEASSDLNDTAASVYVVWGFNLLRVPRVIRYTWSSTLPVGYETTANMGMQKIIVLASGDKNLGRWMTFERDIVADFRKHFRGSVPKRPVAILILSDADDTKSMAKADYTKFMLKSN
jgi:hypothetical protein